MSAPAITWLTPGDSRERFPPVASALSEPDGLLAAGGDLSSARLLAAYRAGIFPWFDEAQPILWWSPDPRCVIFPDRFHVGRTLRRELRRSSCRILIDTQFGAVIDACRKPRNDGHGGTWITADMRDAYARLFDEGWAHSIEVVDNGHLVGGVYGIAIGGVFFGESMFSAVAGASKQALYAISRIDGVRLLDCQVVSPHLLSLGAGTLPRRDFIALLDRFCGETATAIRWPQSVEVASIAP